MKLAKILAVFITISLLFIQTSKAQEITVETDTVKLVKTTQRFSPRKAALLSAAFPGLGQVYNRKYWKVPIVYAGIATFGYFLHSHQTNYVNFSDTYRERLAGKSRYQDPNDRYPNIKDEGLQLRTDFYRRNRDFTIILSALFYGLIITDAMVDAHLAEFNVKDDVALKVQPTIIPTSGSTASAGLSFRLSLK